jgi:hypothetical protein
VNGWVSLLIARPSFPAVDQDDLIAAHIGPVRRLML